MVERRWMELEEEVTPEDGLCGKVAYCLCVVQTEVLPTSPAIDDL